MTDARFEMRAFGFERAVVPPLERLEDASPVMRSVVDLILDSIREEFQAEGWKTPSGGFQPWKETHPFGSKEPAAQILGGTGGRIFRAWEEAARRAQIGPRSVALEVNEPWAAAHRGGSGSRASSAQVTEIPVTPALRGFVRAQFDLNLAHDREFLELPARPHATRNPELVQKIADAFRSYVVEGKT